MYSTAWIFASSSPRRQTTAARPPRPACAVAVATLLLPAAASAASCDAGARLYRQFSPSIVAVEATQGGNIFEPARFGSGVVVAERLVVTANHVVGDAREVSVFSATATPHPAQVLRRHAAADLALLQVGELGAVPATPLSAHNDLPPGSCVAVLGNVMRAGIGIFCGAVSLIMAPDTSGIRGVLTDITTPPGLSGGGLVDCDTGRLAGIVTFGLVNLAAPRDTAGMVGAVPVAELLELLSEPLARGLPERRGRP